MPDFMRVEGLEKLEGISAALKDAADKDLTNRTRKAMRDIAKPVGVEVAHEGAQKMPRRGGFSRRVEGTRPGVSSAIASKSVHVTMTLSNKGANIKSLDAGILRHPVFAVPGVQRTWAQQIVPGHAFTDAFDKQADPARRKVLDAMQNTLNDAAKKAH